MTTRHILTSIIAAFCTLSLYAQQLTATGPVTVVIGGIYSYTNSSITYTLSKYSDGGVEKMDVNVPEFKLDNTLVGNLTLGAYTVKGLEWDAEKQGFYRDYSKDGISFHFKAEGGMMKIDGDYEFNSEKPNNILVQMADGAVTTIVNTFQMGAMPFGIVSTFTNTTAGIADVTADNVRGAKVYNLQGQQVAENAKGIVIVNGKKMLKGGSIN